MHTPEPWVWLNYPDGRKLLAAPSRSVIHCPDAPIGIIPEDQIRITTCVNSCAGLSPEQVEAIPDLVRFYTWPQSETGSDEFGNLIDKVQSLFPERPTKENP